MEPSSIFRTNSPAVLSENIDGEVIIINMDVGNYYSTQRVGAMLWDLIEKRFTLKGMYDSVCAGFEGDRKAIEQAVD